MSNIFVRPITTVIVTIASIGSRYAAIIAAVVLVWWAAYMRHQYFFCVRMRKSIFFINFFRRRDCKSVQKCAIVCQCYVPIIAPEILATERRMAEKGMRKRIQERHKIQINILNILILTIYIHTVSN